MRKVSFLVVSLTLIAAFVAYQFMPQAPVSQAAQGNSSNGKKKSDTSVRKQGKGKKAAVDAAGIQRLKDSTGAKVSVSNATGTVRFARLGRGQGSLARSGGNSAAEKSAAFLRENAGAFGLTNPDAEL